jgi:predicted lipoprotein with Yx(FWY)xxD motif
MQRRGGLLGLIGAACLVAALLITVTPAGAASKPSAPGKPSVAPGMAQVRVTWVAPANNGSPITGYVVTPFVGSKAQTARTFHSTATAQTMTGLTNARTYTFRVAATNAVGTGAPSPASNPVIPTSAPTLRIATNAMLGKQIIVNSYGFTLYLFAPDGKATTSTVPPGIIKQTWPPVAWSGAPKAGPGLSAAKIAIHAQPNRTPQVSYNGHLLYTFLSDTKPGDVTGQNVAQFFVVSPAGNEIP